MPGDVFGCHTWEVGCYQHLVGRARDAAKHPIRHRRAAHNEELAGSNVNHANVKTTTTTTLLYLNKPQFVCL